MSDSVHVPVLSSEILELLAVRPGQTVVDGTLGGGGHTRLLAEHVGTAGRVISLDRDPAAVERARAELVDLPVTSLHGNFCDLPELLAELDMTGVDGILLDLGISSDQLADPDRGFSFHAAGPLDLRFDTTSGEPAWRLLARLSEKHLADMIFAYGEERHSRRIARAIVAARKTSNLESAREIAAIVRAAMPGRRQKIDPATRTFQALRIAVNEELKSLELALRRLPACLNPGGRLAIISFHSLEDRRVKVAFREDDRFETISRKPVRPSAAEVQRNPRSRSARLRVAARVG